MCLLGIQSSFFPYQPFCQVFKDLLLLHRGSWAAIQSPWCPLCCSLVGTLPHVGAQGDSVLPLTKRGRARMVATAPWGLCLVRNSLKRFNGCFIFGIAKRFSIPPHSECSRYQAASTLSREGAKEPSKISSKIFLINTEYRHRR